MSAMAPKAIGNRAVTKKKGDGELFGKYAQ